MARLRIRLRFNPGRVGAPMDKLGEFSSRMERFLRSLARDVGVDAAKGKWLASHFANGSVEFDGTYSEAVEPYAVDRVNGAISAVTGADPLEATNRGQISFTTMNEFAGIGKVLDVDEKFDIGLYSDAAPDAPTWHTVTHAAVSEIRRFLEAPFITVGSLQGVIHSWHTGAEPRFFNLRQLSAGELVRCEYAETLHSLVHEATKIENTVVHVYGQIYWDVSATTATKVEVDDLEAIEPLTPAEFERIFGAAPTFTGELETGEYVDRLWEDEE